MQSAGRLHANVEGDIEDCEGVLRITRIRVEFVLKTDDAAREKAERAFEHFADRCPAYVSVKDCIRCEMRLTFSPPD